MDISYRNCEHIYKKEINKKREEKEKHQNNIFPIGKYKMYNL